MLEKGALGSLGPRQGQGDTCEGGPWCASCCEHLARGAFSASPLPQSHRERVRAPAAPTATSFEHLDVIFPEIFMAFLLKLQIAIAKHLEIFSQLIFYITLNTF